MSDETTTAQPAAATPPPAPPAPPLPDLGELFAQEITLENYRRFREVALANETNAIQLDKLAAALDTKDKKNAMKKGLANYLLGRSKQAVDALEKAHPDEELASLFLGRIHLDENDAAAAREVLKEAAAAHKDSRPLAYAVILATLHLSEVDEAHTLIEKVEKKFGEDAETVFLRGFWLELTGEYEEARKAYERTLQTVPEHQRTLFRLGRWHSLWGDDEKAVEYYERCRKNEPLYSNALINLGTLYEDRGEYDKALDCFREVLQRIPNHSRARMFLKDADASKHMFYDEDIERRADRRSAILKIPVTDFELSVRSRNCLNKMNVKTLGDLVQMTEAELLAHKNFGETSLMEVKQMLAQKGLRLGMGKLDLQALGTPNAPQNVPEEVLKKPISDLELSVRSRKCMERLNIETLADLISRTEAELLAAKNFGQTSLNEVKQRLEEFGLRLKDAAY